MNGVGFFSVFTLTPISCLVRLNSWILPSSQLSFCFQGGRLHRLSMLSTTSLRRLGGLVLLVILALLRFSHFYPLIKPLPSSSQDLSFEFSTPSNQSFPPPNQTYRKRDQDFLNKFGCLVNKGIKYFEEGVVYATEGFGDPPPNYGPNPIRDNGWTVSEAEDPLPAIWDEVFADIPPREPEPDEYTFVKLTQDQKFKNAWHEDNPVSLPKTPMTASCLHRMRAQLIEMGRRQEQRTMGSTSPSPTPSS